MTLPAKPHWIQTMTDSALSIEENLFWECKASGKPKPSYSWLKNGEQVTAEVWDALRCLDASSQNEDLNLVEMLGSLNFQQGLWWTANSNVTTSKLLCFISYVKTQQNKLVLTPLHLRCCLNNRPSLNRLLYSQCSEFIGCVHQSHWTFSIIGMALTCH